MSNSPRAALTRIAFLLLLTCTASFIWESNRNAGLQHVEGQVVAVRHVLAGKGGDSKEFTIRYRWQGQTHDLVTRRGILDALGTLRELKTGDRVSLALRPSTPSQAILDTLSGRYPLTLSLVTLGSVFLAALAFMAMTGRLAQPDKTPEDSDKHQRVRSRSEP